MRAIRRRTVLVPSLLALALLSAPIVSAPPAAAQAAPGIYANAANWICRPDKSDPCDRNLDASVVQANGTVTVERWTPNANAPVDCFYLYPTTSWDWGDNSDRVPNTNQEIYATRLQAARLGTSCRVFAPVYRQVTNTWLTRAYLNATIFAGFPDDLFAVAYADVLASFRHYLANDNGGRGFVLVGHSQGSALLAQLVNDEIRSSATARSRFVSAMLMGLPPAEHPDRSVAPPCTSVTQTGCLVSYQSFRSTKPPAADSTFSASNDLSDCTNPARPGGGRSPLRPYFAASGTRWASGRSITTPFVTVPGLVDGQCVSQGGHTYLSITVNADPRDPRTDNIPGDLGSGLDGEWGMHLADVQLAMGDLIALIASQGAAFQAAHR